MTLEEDERTGHVYASYVPRKAGTHAVRILVGNSEIAGSPFVGCFTAGALTPSRCVARGDGLKRATVGRGALIEVSAHDSSGNAISHGDGSCFEVTMRTAFGHSIECTSRCLDRDDGSYRLVYSTPTAGKNHQLYITCRGVEIRGCPFSVDVKPGKAYAPYCYVMGSGATYAPLRPADALYAHCVDRFRNPCIKGGEKVHVRCSSGPSHPLVNIKDREDGEYLVTTRYGLSGVYQVSVCLWQEDKRVPVAGSPFTVYAGLQLAEQYLVRWLPEMPRTLPALAADPASLAGDVSDVHNRLAIARLGTWRHDAEALAAQALRAWKLFVGRSLLERMVAGTVPAGSPREITRKGVPVPSRPASAPTNTAARGGTVQGRAGRGGVAFTAGRTPMARGRGRGPPQPPTAPPPTPMPPLDLEPPAEPATTTTTTTTTSTQPTVTPKSTTSELKPKRVIFAETPGSSPKRLAGGWGQAAASTR